MVDMPEWFSFLKVRGSYSAVGSSYAAYLTKPYYDYKGQTHEWDSLHRFPNENLKPEKTKSWEVGLNARFFGGKLNFDATWYRSDTFNQPSNRPLRPRRVIRRYSCRPVRSAIRVSKCC